MSNGQQTKAAIVMWNGDGEELKQVVDALAPWFGGETAVVQDAEPDADAEADEDADQAQDEEPEPDEEPEQEPRDGRRGGGVGATCGEGRQPDGDRAGRGAVALDGVRPGQEGAGEEVSDGTEARR